MGDHDVSEGDDLRRRSFMKAVLDDLHALEEMLGRGMIEQGIRRIGAEQEMFLVDEAGRATPTALQILERVEDPRLVTELGQFNLEANLEPRVYGGDCLAQMERELDGLLALVREKAGEVGTRVALCGILPTLRRTDLTLDNMTPDPRYRELNRVMHRMRGKDFHIVIKGLDELDVTHDNVMLEACNTSFQVHFQVGAEEFARLYNLAQVVTGPVLAAGVNSPLLFGQRLWHETRVALFQHSVDTRTDSHRARTSRARVSFGERWVEKSVIEIFREDISRFRSLLAREVEEDPMAFVDRGEAPPLRALRLHSGTVYRWNRACYGEADGVAHLRIENRVLPSGPTVLDEISNAAFYFGLMSGLAESYQDVASHIAFDDAKGNFFAAARHGLDAQLNWLDGRQHSAPELIRNQLAPLARAGLASAGVDSADIDRYIGTIEQRAARKRTGAQWALTSWAQMSETSPELRARAILRAMIERQEEGCPVHEWPLAVPDREETDRESWRMVGQFMTTDLFTVHPEDLVDLAASLMDWEHIRHVPVEDDDGKLVGVISHRSILRLVSRGNRDPVPVRDIMRTDPVTATPETTTLEAIQLMRERRVGALPVLDEGGRLVGIVTEHDLIEVSARLLEAYLKGE